MSPRRSPRKRRITAQDLTRFRLVSEPQVSPDGERILFVHKQADGPGSYATNLWMVGAEAGDPQPFTAGDADGRPRWSPDGERIAFVAAREKERPQIHLIPADGGEARPLTCLPPGSIGAVAWSPRGDTIAFAFRPAAEARTEAAGQQREADGASEPPRILDHWYYRYDGDGTFDGQRHALYVVDVDSGAHRVLYDGDTLGRFDFDFTPDGAELVVATNRSRRAGLEPWNDELLRVRVADGRVREIPVTDFGPKSAVACSPDGRWIAYAGRVGKDGLWSCENLELWICDAKTGRTRSLTGSTDTCLSAAPMSDTADASFGATFRWRPDSKGLLAAIGWRGEQHIAAVPLRGDMTFLTKGRKVHGLGNLSADGRRAALTVGTPTRLGEVHLGQVDGERIATTARTRLNAALLSELELSTPRAHRVKTPDGTEVHTWVLTPPGHDGRRRLPAVLEIHGGPHAQYGVGFFHELQLLAASGYAVFYGNPRGSKGYGRDHCAAIRGDWGGPDWRDVQAVTAFMQEQVYVDEARIGVMGGSYGGYMTCWAIGHSRAYRAAIADRCVSNLVSMSGSSDHPLPPDQYFPGDPWGRAETRWQQSPIRSFDRVRTPTLIIHSEGDLRCNIEQGEQVFAALQVRGVRSRFVRYPASTSHGMSRSGPPDLRIHRLQQILDWWAEHLGRKRRRAT